MEKKTDLKRNNKELNLNKIGGAALANYIHFIDVDTIITLTSTVCENFTVSQLHDCCTSGIENNQILASSNKINLYRLLKKTKKYKINNNGRLWP